MEAAMVVVMFVVVMMSARREMGEVLGAKRIRNC